jgi:hypothetical protein
MEIYSFFVVGLISAFNQANEITWEMNLNTQHERRSLEINTFNS